MLCFILRVSPIIMENAFWGMISKGITAAVDGFIIPEIVLFIIELRPKRALKVKLTLRDSDIVSLGHITDILTGDG